MRRMHDTGEYAISDLAEVFDVSRPTVYRTLARTRASAGDELLIAAGLIFDARDAIREQCRAKRHDLAPRPAHGASRTAKPGTILPMVLSQRLTQRDGDEPLARSCSHHRCAGM